MSTTQYNGWTNYETWAVKLWIDNEEGSQNYWLDEAARARRHTTGKRDAVYQLSQQLKDEHNEAAPEVSGVFADLMNAALGSVDWYEIAESLLEDAEEIDPENDANDVDEEDELDEGHNRK